MTPYVALYFSPDVDELETWQPKSPRDIYIWLQMNIGFRGEVGTDLFDLMIASPEALRSHAGQFSCIVNDRLDGFPDCEKRNRNLVGRCLVARHHLIVMDYNWTELRTVIEAIVASCEAPTWEEAASKLSRYFAWEYEDYVTPGAED